MKKLTNLTLAPVPIPIPACYWCSREATRIDYRDFDGCVSRIKSCDECFELSNSALRKKYPTPSKK